MLAQSPVDGRARRASPGTSRRACPQLPRWLVWGWLMTLPWTLEFSTHIINPSYLLAPALVFFIGFFEAVPAFRLGKMPEPVAFVLMGAAISWVLQIHMSWPLLAAATRRSPGSRAGAQARGRSRSTRRRSRAVSCCSRSLLIPTFVVYGLQAGSGGTLRNLRPHWVNPWIAVTTLARLFSFASLEIWRFIATDDGKRLMFLLAPPLDRAAGGRGLAGRHLAAVLDAARVVSHAVAARRVAAAQDARGRTVALVYASYWFVLEPPQAHAFYVVAPVAFMFAAYCWTFVDSPRWRRIAARRPRG